jgi:hypothetical protein
MINFQDLFLFLFCYYHCHHCAGTSNERCSLLPEQFLMSQVKLTLAVLALPSGTGRLKCPRILSETGILPIPVELNSVSRGKTDETNMI